MPLKNCVVCGTQFMARLSVYKTCGVVCRNRLIAAEKEAKHTTTQPCIVCGKEFSNTGKQKHRKTCSPACGHVVRAKARERQIEHNCKTCGTLFTAEQSRDAQYCSMACMYQRNEAQTTRDCEVCGKPFSSPPSHMHVRSCSDECGNKLRGESNTKEKIVVTCEQCGVKFDEHESHAGRRKFCSHKCMHENEDTKLRMSAAFAGGNNPAWQGGITVKSVSKNGRAYGRLNRAKENEKSAKRKALKLQATPAWADPVLILEFYEECQRISTETGVVHHVDHTVPLTSKTVCGLHCEFNLQVLPGIENLRKHNRTWPDKP